MKYSDELLLKVHKTLLAGTCESLIPILFNVRRHEAKTLINKARLKYWDDYDAPPDKPPIKIFIAPEPRQKLERPKAEYSNTQFDKHLTNDEI